VKKKRNRRLKWINIRIECRTGQWHANLSRSGIEENRKTLLSM
jgi:hypothetical protein